ncbi:MAG: hypothetical protein AABY15_04190 [Nanoarchaeota archaeon]
MGYIPSAETVYAVAYLTETGRNYLFNKDNNRFDTAGDDLFEIKKFTLSDSDTNYQTVELLESGDVPDVTGKSEGCLKTTANYVQSNLISFIFDSTPTSVEYSTDLPDATTPTLSVDEDDLADIAPGETPPLGSSPSGPSLPGGFSAPAGLSL